MTDIADLAFRVDSLPIVTAEKRMDSLNKANDRTTDGAGMLTGAYRVLGTAMATIGVASVVNDALQAYKSYESMSAGLKSVTGSADAAKIAMGEILEFAKETPFTLDQSIIGYQRLKALGLDPSMESMRSYGNTASAMRMGMVSMIEAVADAVTGEFERLKNFGIKAKKTGEDIKFIFQGTTTTVKNNAEEIQKYLLSLGTDKFGTAMADQMNTINGAAANLDDAIFQLQVNFAEATARVRRTDKPFYLCLTSLVMRERMPYSQWVRAIDSLSLDMDHMSEVWSDSFNEMEGDSNDAFTVFGRALREYGDLFGKVIDAFTDSFRMGITYMPIILSSSFEAMSLTLKSWYYSAASYWEMFKGAVINVMAYVELHTGGVFTNIVNFGREAVADLIAMYASLVSLSGRC